MQRLRTLSLVTIVALIASLCLTTVAGANPPAPGDATSQPPAESAGARQTNPGKSIDQPNIKDYQRLELRQELIERGLTLEASALDTTASDRILVVLVEFAGTDTATWNPGDTWDPIAVADPNEAVYDEDGALIVGDCSNIITQTKTFTYTGPLHNQMPRPLSEADRSGQSIWTEDFSRDWFNSFMFGNGIKFQYTRQDGSQVDEDFTGISVKNFYQDMSGGKYDIEGDVIGWLPLNHSAMWYGADSCPGTRSGGSTADTPYNGQLPGGGSQRSMVRDALMAVNAISDTIPGFSWQNYDRDGDGVIDRLWVVHAGYGEEDATTLLNRVPNGEGAAWSHSSSGSLFPVADGISAGPYIMMPENGGVGVFAHEYGHNLGADDLYAYQLGETSAGFWTIMADDWTGYPIGYQPPAADPWHLDRWGWLEPVVIDNPNQVYEFKLGQASNFPGGDGVYRGARIELSDGVLPLAAPVWQGSHYWWGGAEDIANGSMTTKDPIAVPAGAKLSFDLAYDIEEGWDFMWVQASEDGASWTTLTNANTKCAHDAGWIGEVNGFPADICAAGIGGFTGYNDAFPEPEKQEFDLSAFAGKNVWLRLWYMTDWGTVYSGPFVDNVQVTANGATVFADDAEYGDAKWTYAAPWTRSDGTRQFTHNFYLQWRNTGEDGGYDSALGDSRWRYGPANTGLTVWYNNNFYKDNEPWNYLTDYPGFGAKGRMLIVDSHPEPYRDPNYIAAGYNNEAVNTDHRGQMRDATFSLNDTVPFKYPSVMPGTTEWINFASRPAVSSFHDAYGYYPGAENVPGGPVGQTTNRWMTKQWDASVVIPATKFYGVKAPGYNGTDRFRFNCSLNAAGQTLCYSYATGLGYKGGTGNPGDIMAQYGWHVEIVDQTSQIATIRVWNAIQDFDGAITHTPSTTPVVRGTTIKVDVKATNIGSPINGLFIAPLDTEEAYVEGSAYGGAFPVTAAQAASLAKQQGGAKLEGLRAAADADTVVGVAAMAKPATGGSVNFGFSTVVTANTGELKHSVAVFDSATFVSAITSDAVTITAAAQTVNETFTATADTYISRGLPNTNFGAWPFIYVGGDDVLRGLVQFDVSKIAATDPVDSATLSVYVAAFGGGGSSANLAAHEILTAWAQNTVTWKAPWTTPGGDVNPVAVGVAPITKDSVGKWVKIDVTAAVQQWVADGASNHGLILRLVDATSFTTYRLPTVENGWLGQNAPVLAVTYRKP